MTVKEIEGRVAEIAATRVYDLAESMIDDLMIDVLEWIMTTCSDQQVTEIVKATYEVYMLPLSRFTDEDNNERGVTCLKQK